MKYLLTFLLVAGAFLAIGGQTAARAETAASIQGKVSHGVNAEANVSGLEVTLVGLGPDGAPLESRKTTTSETGGFAFTDLAAGEGYIYQVGVRYAEVTYASAGLRLTADTRRPSRSRSSRRRPQPTRSSAASTTWSSRWIRRRTSSGFSSTWRSRTLEN